MAKIEVTSPTDVGLIIKEASGQTANAFEIQNSLGVILFYIDKDGNISSGGGDVYGPVSSTDNAIARYDGVLGAAIQDSVVTIDDTTGTIKINTHTAMTDPGAGATGTKVLNDLGQWVVGGGGAGDVVGPGSATDHAFARFDTTTGKLIQNSLVTADDSGSVNIPTGQSYKINNVALTYTDVGAAASGTGVTNGDSHNHSGGDGAQIDHTTLSNIGSNSHSAIDTAVSNSASHISAASPHSGHAIGIASTTDNRVVRFDSTGGKQLQDSLMTIDDSGSPNIPSGQTYNINGSAHSHTGLVTNGDSHDHSGGDGAQIAHTALSSIGTNTHAQIDTHLASTSNPHSVTATQVGLGNVTNNAQIKDPGSSVDEQVLRWDGTSGDTVQACLLTVNDSGTANIPSGQTYNINGSAHAHGVATGGTGTNTWTQGNIPYSSSGTTNALTAIPNPDSTTKFLKCGNATPGAIAYEWATPSGTGDVVGPGSATDNAVARFDLTTGKLIQNSAVTIADTTGSISINNATGALIIDGNTAISKPDGTTTKFARADGTWQTPTGSGDFVGPASSTDNAIVRFDGTGGKTGQNSVVTVADTTGLIAINAHSALSDPGATPAYKFAKDDGTWQSVKFGKFDFIVYPTSSGYEAYSTKTHSVRFTETDFTTLMIDLYGRYNVRNCTSSGTTAIVTTESDFTNVQTSDTIWFKDINTPYTEYSRTVSTKTDANNITINTSIPTGTYQWSNVAVGNNTTTFTTTNNNFANVSVGDMLSIKSMPSGSTLRVYVTAKSDSNTLTVDTTVPTGSYYKWTPWAGSVCFMPGTYNVATSISMRQSIRALGKMTGAGEGQTTFKATAGLTDGILRVCADNWEIEGITFDGNNQSACVGLRMGDNAGENVYTALRCTIKDCTFLNFSAGSYPTCLKLDGNTYYNNFESLRMMDNNLYCIHFNDTTGTLGDNGQMLFQNCEIAANYYCVWRTGLAATRHRIEFDRCGFYCGSTSSTYAVDFAGINNLHVNNCDFEATAIPTTAFIGVGGTNQVFTACSCEANGIPIFKAHWGGTNGGLVINGGYYSGNSTTTLFSDITYNFSVIEIAVPTTYTGNWFSAYSVKRRCTMVGMPEKYSNDALFKFVDDFDGREINANYWSATNCDTGATVGLATNKQAGVVRLSTTASTNNQAVLDCSAVSNATWAYSTFEAIVKLDSSPTNLVYFIGLYTDANNYIGFQINTATSANWYGVSANGGVSSSVDLGVAGSTDLRFLRWWVDGTTDTAYFQVDDARKGSLAATYVPVTGLAYPRASCKTLTTSIKTLEIDRIEFTTRRA